jgi:hypothetical protein
MNISNSMSHKLENNSIWRMQLKGLQTNYKFPSFQICLPYVEFYITSFYDARKLRYFYFECQKVIRISR